MLLATTYGATADKIAKVNVSFIVNNRFSVDKDGVIFQKIKRSKDFLWHHVDFLLDIQAVLYQVQGNSQSLYVEFVLSGTVLYAPVQFNILTDCHFIV